jgi:TPR repeat protein
MYYHGEGILQDYIYAYMWWNIAASTGNESAVYNREAVEKDMTPSQIEKAQDLARECVAKDYKGC